MVKIVDQAIKIDLHIHSKKSYFKDKAIVENSDINNIKTLIDALLDNKVNLCAITDHDSFDYDLYSKLKKEEKKIIALKKFYLVWNLQSPSKEIIMLNHYML